MNLEMLDDSGAEESIRKQMRAFLEKNSSILVDKSPEFIIEKWLEWQFSRYAVDEQPEAFYVNDLRERKVVACIMKKDPQAYYHAHAIRDDLSKIKCDGVITVDDSSYMIGITDIINDKIRDDDE